MLEPLANLVARLPRGGHIEPVATRPVLPARRYHLDDVARLQSILQRHQAIVDLRTNAAVANVGMHEIGEVERRCASRKLFHVTLRREDIDLILEHIKPDAFKEL